MTRLALVALSALLVVGAANSVRAVPSPSGIDPRLTLDWDVVRTHSGRPEIRGYIYNDHGRPAINVRLIVETLDADGRVVDRAYGYVVGPVPVFNRSLFIVPLRTAGSSYRITVTSFEWRDGGSG